ncbi:hypothetical protein RBSWK_02747 [Rhodopirellula baltica SWK14]|uniref:Uncharacterized protein n=1 Tax=Rhodopirellula baltica SWK14 TaxID=993516 RepID=L7CH65_RHOBT|nr:hypothetical protein RBSWK_02747 [Rhodopirellula baltica SWK14]
MRTAKQTATLLTTPLITFRSRQGSIDVRQSLFPIADGSGVRRLQSADRCGKQV